MAVTDVEPCVPFAKTPLHSFGVEAKTVEPDVVLSQAHVNVEGVVFFRAFQERLDHGGGTDEAGLVV